MSDTDEFYDASNTSPDAEDPSAALRAMSQQYTTQEAHDIAKGAYTKYSADIDKQRASEDQALGTMDNSVGDVRAALLKARTDLVSRRNTDRAQMWLGLSAALGSPTRSGSFGETVGNAAESLQKSDQMARMRQQAADEQGLKYTQDIGSLDQGMAGQQLAVAKAREASNAKLLQESMRVLGREIKPGGAAGAAMDRPMSPYGKMAQDMGLTLGTQAYMDKVKELRDEDLKIHQAQAGLDAAPVAPDQKVAQAYHFGVPVATVDPFAGLGTKQRQTQTARVRTEAEKQLDTIGKDEDSANQAINDAQRFLKLNDEVHSGQLIGRLPAFSAAAQEMDKKAYSMARTLRLPSERPTNYDNAMWLKATMGRDKDYDTNKNLATAYIQQKQLHKDYISYMRNYFATNGHLIGANQEWDTYLNNNSVFNPATPGVFNLNTKRVDYKTFFRKQHDDQQADIPAPVLPGVASGPDDPTRRIGAATPTGFARGGHVRKLAEGGSVEDHQLALDDLKKVSDQLETMHTSLGSGISREALQGALMGFGDEALAGVETPFTKNNYHQNLTKERAILEDFQARHPVAAFSSQLAGAIPTMVGGGEGLGALAARYAPKLAQAAQASRVVAPIASNAAVGAITGAGAGDDRTGRGAGAVEGAVLGGALGPLAGLATKYGVGGIQAIMARLTQQPAASAAEKAVADALEKSGMDPSDVLKQIQASYKNKVPARVLDVGGQDTQALAQAVAGRNTPGGRALAQGATDLQAGARDRVAAQVNQGLKPDEYFAQEQKLVDNLYTNARPLYDQAYQQFPKVKSEALMDIMGTPSGKKAAATAFKMMQDEGIPIGQADAKGMVRQPSLQYMDYVKRALDDQINGAESQGFTSQGKILRGMRNRLRDELDTATTTPGSPSPYAQARAQYAGDLEIRDALQMGREDFDKMAPQELQNKVNDMSYMEKDALRSGIAQNLYEKISNPSTDINAAQKIVGSPAVNGKLMAAFDDPKSFELFRAALTREAQMFQANKAIQTAAMRGRLGAAEHVPGNAMSTIMGGIHPYMGVGEAGPWGGISGTSLVGKMAHFLASKPTMSDKTASDVADILRTGSPNDVAQLMAKMDTGIGRTEGRQATARAIAGPVGGATATGAVASSESPQGYAMEQQ